MHGMGSRRDSKYFIYNKDFFFGKYNKYIAEVRRRTWQEKLIYRSTIYTPQPEIKV